MREFRTPGSVRGAPGNGRPYRDMEYDGSVESGVVVTDAVACASRLRYDL